jgi:hypothetical protein
MTCGRGVHGVPLEQVGDRLKEKCSGRPRTPSHCRSLLFQVYSISEEPALRDPGSLAWDWTECVGLI